MMTVCYPLASVTEAPDLMSQQVDELLFGETCEILEESGAFARVRTDYGYEGYVERRALMEPLHAPNRMVSVPFCDLLCENRNFFRPMMTLPRGSRLDVGYSDTEKRYGFAVLPSKRIWYVHKEHLRPLPNGLGTEEALRQGIVTEALSYLGTQYRWGGRSPSGVDCSGLCFMAYRLNGLTIWRDADISKNEHLRQIPLAEAKPGDLLFFPGHMALSLGGDAFLHASASAGKVIRDDFTKGSYGPALKEQLLCAATYFA
ncbi:MAG: C40 family peptidase [Oscillospiraceae bacterium]|nr:C40 family peptidase [Oscillospiraceae bacterium]